MKTTGQTNTLQEPVLPIKFYKTDRVKKYADRFIRSPEVRKLLLETEYMAAILISVNDIK